MSSLFNNNDELLLTARLEQGLFDMGAALVGYAALSRHLDARLLTGGLFSRSKKLGPRAISIAAPIRMPVLRRGPDSLVSTRSSLGAANTADDAFHEIIAHGPTAAYLDALMQAAELARQLAELSAGFLQRRGYAASVQAGQDRLSPDGKTPNLADEDVAAVAGLGWIGKNSLLTTRRYGSALRLATVFTDAPLPCGTPVSFSSCGSCNLCVESCPAKALADAPWTAGVRRDGQLNLKACQKFSLKSAQKNIGQSLNICGRCLAACPYVTRF